MVSIQDLSDHSSLASRPPFAERRAWMLVAFYLALSGIALYPIFAVAVPPLVDYPNHLARIHVLSAWEDLPALQQNYQIEWSLQPNVAMDLLLLQFAKILPIYDLGRLYIAATMLMLVGGTLTLARVVHGRFGLWPGVIFLFLYNKAFYWGFLNFLFFSGFYLFALGAWIGLRERSCWLRLALFPVLSFVLYFGHPIALGLYGLSILGYEFWRMWRQADRWSIRGLRDWAITAAQFIVPCLLFLFWYLNHGNTGAGSTSYGPLPLKMTALIAPVLFDPLYFDFAVALFVGLVGVWAWSERSVAFAPELKVPAVLLVVTAVLMPSHLFGVWGADFRISVLLAFVVIAGMRIETPAVRASNFVLVIALGLFVSRVVMVTDAWQTLDRRFEEFRQAAQSIDVGDSVLVVLDREDAETETPERRYFRYWHMAALAVIDRQAFFPYLFTGHTTITASPARSAIDSPAGVPVSRTDLQRDMDPKTSQYRLGQSIKAFFRAYWTAWPENFDYVLVIRFRNPTNPVPSHLDPVHVGSYFDLYRVLGNPKPGDEPAP